MSGSFALFLHSWGKEIELSLPFFHLSLERVVLEIIETSTVVLKYVTCTIYLPEVYYLAERTGSLHVANLSWEQGYHV